MSSDDSNPPEWTKVTLPMPPKSQWRTKPGYKIFVGDAGAVRLEFPQTWVVRHERNKPMTFHDNPPPGDTARMSLTVFNLPPMPPNWWAEMPMEQMMREASKGKDDSDAPPLKMTIQQRHGMEIGWLEKAPWTDPETGKPIRCRHLLARGRRTQILLTFDVYQDTGNKFESVWEHLLKSVRLEVPVNVDGSGRN